jgi:hypothetical protein
MKVCVFIALTKRFPVTWGCPKKFKFFLMPISLEARHFGQMAPKLSLISSEVETCAP